MTSFLVLQRWAIIRKRRNNLNAGANHAGAHRTESQLAATHAANHAMSLALAGPPAKNLTAGLSCPGDFLLQLMLFFSPNMASIEIHEK